VFAAAVFLIEKIKSRKNPGADPWNIITCGVVALAILATLLFTHSKGAITAFIIAVIFFAGALLFGKQLYAYRRKIAFIAVLLVAAALAALFYYGLSHHKLPGGNSMLVRQQYWQSAVRIYEDHPLTGIGGGNFANYYFHYKMPQSLESVSDPHNFLLSILVQYGPLGLAGFLAIIIIPLYLIIFPPLTRTAQSVRSAIDEPINLKFEISNFKLNRIVVAGAAFAMLLLIRPLVDPLPKGVLPEERIASLFILYLIPAAAFLIGFLLISAGGLFNQTAGTTLQNEAGEAAYPIEIVAALFCAVAGVLMHNVVDFAILEPPVLTAFCACLACLVSTDLNYRGQGVAIRKLQPAGKALPVAASIAVFIAVLYFGLMPVKKSLNEMAGANSFAVIGQFGQAHLLLESATKDDPLSPLGPSVNGRFYTAEYLGAAVNAAKAGKPDNNTGLLFDKAEKNLLEAIRRDKASYKDYERLSNLYVLSAEQNSEPQKKAEWLNKAYKTAEQTVALYPSSDKLRFYIAQIAGELGNKDVALENYKKAVEFEDAFREQFRIMYPGWKSSSGEFSRLGQDKYDAAKKQIELLSK
jgi:hypothetical protein